MGKAETVTAIVTLTGTPIEVAHAVAAAIKRRDRGVRVEVEGWHGDPRRDPRVVEAECEAAREQIEAQR